MYDLDAIKKIPIDVVISDCGVKLKRVSENEFSALCPFHDDIQPSFRANTEKNVFHCFGCGAHGDVITFIQMFKELSFVEAVKYLKKKYNIKYSFSNLSKIRKAENYRKEILFLEKKIKDILDSTWDVEWYYAKPFYSYLYKFEKTGDVEVVFSCLKPICDFDIFENWFWSVQDFLDTFFRKVRSDREGVLRTRKLYENFLKWRRYGKRD